MQRISATAAAIAGLLVLVGLQAADAQVRSGNAAQPVNQSGAVSQRDVDSSLSTITRQAAAEKQRQRELWNNLAENTSKWSNYSVQSIKDEQTRVLNQMRRAGTYVEKTWVPAYSAEDIQKTSDNYDEAIQLKINRDTKKADALHELGGVAESGVQQSLDGLTSQFALRGSGSGQIQAKGTNLYVRTYGSLPASKDVAGSHSDASELVATPNRLVVSRRGRSQSGNGALPQAVEQDKLLLQVKPVHDQLDVKGKLLSK